MPRFYKPAVSQAKRRRIYELTEDIGDAVRVPHPPWPRIAAWAEELAHLIRSCGAAPAKAIHKPPT